MLLYYDFRPSARAIHIPGLGPAARPLLKSGPSAFEHAIATPLWFRRSKRGFDMRQLLRLCAMSLVLAFGGVGWAQTPAAAPPPAAATAAAPAPASVDTPVRAVPEYRLGVADKVRVNVFGEDALTGEFLVGGGGKISLPLIGEVQAAGLTISEFQNEVGNELRKGYIKEPRVSAEVLSYRPFYIMGEVNKPGEYPYTNNLTVLNAVATAEGFTYRANKRSVYIKRAEDPVEQSYPLTPLTKVAPGDTIRIGERYF
ncbi:MAG TPA: polysaccharide biosynthesis/export family protein [Caulobacter sp.]|nr:polysaccharide biosynthesis/export family protein [Caulobacter sp.]